MQVRQSQILTTQPQGASTSTLVETYEMEPAQSKAVI